MIFQGRLQSQIRTQSRVWTIYNNPLTSTSSIIRQGKLFCNTHGLLLQGGFRSLKTCFLWSGDVGEQKPMPFASKAEQFLGHARPQRNNAFIAGKWDLDSDDRFGSVGGRSLHQLCSRRRSKRILIRPRSQPLGCRSFLVFPVQRLCCRPAVAASSAFLITSLDMLVRLVKVRQHICSSQLRSPTTFCTSLSGSLCGVLKEEGSKCMISSAFRATSVMLSFRHHLSESTSTTFGSFIEQKRTAF